MVRCNLRLRRLRVGYRRVSERSRTTEEIAVKTPSGFSKKLTLLSILDVDNFIWQRLISDDSSRFGQVL